MKNALTSLAFILGVAPLMFASGAGAEMRRSPGTAVFSGMLGVTGFGLLFTPGFYTIIRTVLESVGYDSRRTGFFRWNREP
jgi:multidrug efflux pump subunit AcrB